MLIVGDVLVSPAIVEEYFCCPVTKCKGVCCIIGDFGAPLEENEIQEIENVYPVLKKYLPEKNRQAIAKRGLYEKDKAGRLFTALVNGKECVFTYFENGIAKCGFEKAFSKGYSTFKKPISCFLYPIRVSKAWINEALNYDKWKYCSVAIPYGKKKKLRLYQFLKKALIKKYGKSWYAELEHTAEQYLKSEECV